MLRLVPTAVAILALLLPATASAQRTQRQIETNPVTFTLSSPTCPNLPPGTTVTGQGMLTSVTWTQRRRGVTNVANSSVATGTATDQAGNAYTFAYSNQFIVNNTRKRPNRYAGLMIDTFELHGPAPLQNGFLARFRTDLEGNDRIRPIDEFGDPIDFDALEPRCDPL